MSTNDESLRSLTDQMRAATREDHDKSDRLVNLKLALVLTSPALYGEALALFLPVFEKLEEILERNSDHSEIGKLHPMLPVLCRTPGFRDDFAYYVSGERRQELESCWKNGDHAVIAEYVGRLERLEKEDPIKLLAYAYHLYGGVLAGGQIISKTVRKAMGLPRDQDEGVMVFKVKDKTTMSNKGVFRKVKSVFNGELVLSEEEQTKLIQEGKEVFRLNNALVGTVRSTSAWTQAADSLTKRLVLILCVLLSLCVAWHVFYIGSNGE